MSELISSPEEAEVNASLWMQVLGFHDAEVTRYTSDGGLDVLSTRAVAQVKLQFAPVGRPHLQNLVGAAVEHPGKMRLFFALKGYSAPAVAYAEQNGIALFSYSIDGNSIVPENTMAHHLYEVMLAQLPETAGQPVAPLPAPAAPPAQPKQDFAAWFTPKRIKWLVLGVVALILAIFFSTHPAALQNVIFTLVVILVFGGWLMSVMKPKKRRRAPARRRR